MIVPTFSVVLLASAGLASAVSPYNIYARGVDLVSRQVCSSPILPSTLLVPPTPELGRASFDECRDRILGTTVAGITGAMLGITIRITTRAITRIIRITRIITTRIIIARWL